MNCPKCNAPLESDDVFCPGCGAKLDAAPPMQATTVPIELKKKPLPTKMIAIIVAVVVVVGGGIGTAFALQNRNRPPSGSITTIANNAQVDRAAEESRLAAEAEESSRAAAEEESRRIAEEERNAVSKGSFDLTDFNGYSYNISYVVNGKPTVNVDTTVGKPGELGVQIIWPSYSLTVTNTTPGKRAPVPDLDSLIFLYPKSSISSIVENFPNQSHGDNKKFRLDVIDTFLRPVSMVEFNAKVGRYERNYENAVDIFGKGESYDSNFLLNTKLGGSEFMVNESRTKSWEVLKSQMFIISEVNRTAFVEVATQDYIGVAMGGMGVPGFIHNIDYTVVMGHAKDGGGWLYYVSTAAR